jgi:hypothetical protein
MQIKHGKSRREKESLRRNIWYIHTNKKIFLSTYAQRKLTTALTYSRPDVI